MEKLEHFNESATILNTAQIWQEFLALASQEVGSRVVETWLKAVTISRYDAETKTVYLKAPNTFIKDWIMLHYSTLIKTHLCRLLHEQQVSLFLLDESRVETTPAVVASTLQAKKVTVHNSPSKNLIQSNHHFENLVVGPHNAMAVAAALAVAKEPGAIYNPLCIYGGSGLGKTHLLQAVGNRIRTAHGKARILYQSGDRFVHEFITSIRFDNIAAFEARYKNVDVLLIDDIQCLAHKEQTQEAFFTIFNRLYESGKQIVFSADTHPSEIKGLQERLRTRFNGGLIADIQPPTLETKIEILQKKAIAQKESLSDDVASFIASRVTSNVRELEGFLIRILAFATLTQQAVSLDLAHKVLNRTPIESVRQARLGLPQVADRVAKHFGYTIHELRSTKRQKNLVLARHCAMYIMKKVTDHSLLDIAAFWCRKDHSTVIHAIHKVEQLRQADSRLHSELARLESSSQKT
jgi:chromosomal replication initiator protein